MEKNEYGHKTQERNVAMRALVWITGFLLIGGVVMALLFSILAGAIMVGLGLVMGVITLVTKAIVSSRE